MRNVRYRTLTGNSIGQVLLLAGLGVLAGLGYWAAHGMDLHGHHVTGMNNRIVWGAPHVFAVFLIVAASGALNMASVGSVFGQDGYKPMARLSGLLAITLLIGGLLVLVLDLGRPDRLIVAMTNYNPKSIFAWNILLYTGFIAVVAAYLWTLFERRFNRYSRRVGLGAFIWRLVLTAGTGSIFGFLVAREAYGTALLAPTFIAMSLSFGTALFLLLLIGVYRGTLPVPLVRRLADLLGVFVAAVLLFVLLYHLTNLYVVEKQPLERFLLLEGGRYTAAFWLGQILLGTLLPLALLYLPRLQASTRAVVAAAVLVPVGGLAQLYVLIVAGQAYPLPLFPGMEVTSGFYGGDAAVYVPSPAELILGMGGVAFSLLLTLLALRILPFLPEHLHELPE